MKTKVYKQIHSCFASACSSDVFLYQKFSLPFAPFVGLEIVQRELHIGPLTSVAWDDITQEFRCYVGADKTLYYAAHQGERNPPKLSEIVERYTTEGWLVENPK